ncbi:coiled-coil domain-containing protein 181 isoform X2 [Pelobates fuscus]|uniref:coiled-coil domain-containing protein 181 isoform X2 n=1 Tax=Pelobates fuscus TaxID=191477 RepID=UPI002FE4DF8A
MGEKEEEFPAGSQEYEDDFEKDLDWLINEDNENGAGPQNHTGEEHIDDLKLNTNRLEKENKENNHSYSETESPSDGVYSEANSLETMIEGEDNFIDDEEAKRYIAEKIEQANKQLENETVDENRERKLKFKDNLVDLEVPPLEYVESERSEEDVVDSLSQLHVSEVPSKENEHQLENGSSEEEHKEGKILVEKDGKFELVNLQDIESSHFLPPINNEKDPSKHQVRLQQSDMFGTSPCEKGFIKQKASNNIEGFYPKPPSQPKGRPGSAAYTVNSVQKSTRRVQSATLPSRNTTFSLSPEQKQLQKRIQEKQERLKKEEVERQKEMEENKRKENEIAFKAWLQKKRGQLFEERRIQQAKVLEKMNVTDEERDPEEAFNRWLKKKHQEHLKERKIEDLKKQEAAFYLNDRGDCERAFTTWLRQKRIQKRIEHQEAKERSRRLLVEARRAKQMHNLLYNISETNSFRYMGGCN